MYFRGGELRLKIETASFDLEAFLMDLSFNIEGGSKLFVDFFASDFIVQIDVNVSIITLHLL